MDENTILRKILANAMKLKAKVEWQYSDYSENEWTASLRITMKDLERILTDNSIRKVRIIIDT